MIFLVTPGNFQKGGQTVINNHRAAIVQVTDSTGTAAQAIAACVAAADQASKPSWNAATTQLLDTTAMPVGKLMWLDLPEGTLKF